MQRMRSFDEGAFSKGDLRRARSRHQKYQCFEENALKDSLLRGGAEKNGCFLKATCIHSKNTSHKSRCIRLCWKCQSMRIKTHIAKYTLAQHPYLPLNQLFKGIIDEIRMRACESSVLYTKEGSATVAAFAEA